MDCPYCRYIECWFHILQASRKVFICLVLPFKMYYRVLNNAVIWWIKWNEAQEVWMGARKSEVRKPKPKPVVRRRFEVSKLIRRWEEILNGGSHVGTQQKKSTEPISEHENG